MWLKAILFKAKLNKATKLKKKVETALKWAKLASSF
jgi:hypothetical protein